MSPAMQTQLIAFVFQVLTVAVPLLLAAFFAWLHTYVAPVLKDQRQAAWMAICVQYAEQWLGSKTGDEKADEVTERFSAKFPQVPFSDMVALRESAVLALKKDLPHLLAVGTGTLTSSAAPSPARDPATPQTADPDGRTEMTALREAVAVLQAQVQQKAPV